MTTQQKLLTSSEFLENVHKLQIDSLIKDTRKPLEPLVYAHTNNKISFVLNLLRLHNIVSIPIFDDAQKKFVSIVNVVHINRFLMLKEVFNKLDDSGSTNHIDEGIKLKISNLYEEPISKVIYESNLINGFKVYHKTDPLIDGLKAMSTRENVYAILVSTSDKKENIEGDIQHTIILSQWDAINYVLNNPILKARENVKTLESTANKVMQRSWITFTKKDDPNQPSHRLSVTPVQTTFALSITQDMTALAGFKVLAIHRLSSVAIVEKKDVLDGIEDSKNVRVVDNLSSSDIRYLNAGHITDGLLTVTEFLDKIRAHPENVVCCHEDTTLGEIMKISIDSKVHRVWVTEKDSKKPLGVVSMSDMLGMLVG